MPRVPLHQRLAILKNNQGWFGRAPEAFQSAILSRCKWVSCSAGQPIYRTTDVHINFCGVIDGAVEIHSRFGAGDNPLLHVLHEGSWIGYGTVVQRSLPRVSALARVETLLASIPDHWLKSLLEARPEWWEVIASGLMEYGDTAISAYADSLLGDHNRRCASVLLRITGLNPPRRSRPERTDVPVTQQELATMAHVSRTTLVQVLRRFEAQGLVEGGYRKLRVADELGLRAIATGST